MDRQIYRDLLKWKNASGRKPLVLEGARQVGKTWILKVFGEKEFDDLVYLNCDNNPFAANLFRDYDIKRMLRDLSAISGKKIEPGKSFIVFDEIQEVPKGIAALKYFCEEAPEYHVAAAGSLLGMEIHAGTGFPVGKVDEMKLFPLNFSEFMRATGDRMLADVIDETAESGKWEDLGSFREHLIDLLRQYYYVGGMPAAVKDYCERNDLSNVRRIQNDILRDYRRDFSKHAPADEVPRINMVWDSVPSQLAKENKKFIYGAIKKGSRAKDFEKAIQWLIDAGLVHKVNAVTKIEKPLKFYENIDAFKLYMNDLGLLGAMAETEASEVLLGNNTFTEYKGAFTEQYVAQQMISEGIKPYYYKNERSTMEIDFVIQCRGEIHPVEVKAEENLRSRSLRAVIDKNTSLKGWRFSMSDYRNQDWMINVPLYLVDAWLQ